MKCDHCFCYAGVIVDNADNDLSLSAFRYQLEKHNNRTSTTFKLDEYIKTVDVSDDFQLIRAGLKHYILFN